MNVVIIKITGKLLFLFLVAFQLAACGQANRNTKTIGKVQAFEINKPESEWKKTLTPDQYYVLREKGTEKPFTGEFYLHKEKGTYTCAACGNKLFTDNMKFDSECGWPSFDKEIEGGKIIKNEDNSLGMKRVEILCAKCGGHLGHLFNDGPTETSQRYCVNSLSLEFVGKDAEPKTEATADTATLAGGCFWCIEAVYQMLDGVKSVESGYSGGTTKNPTYSKVGSGSTGHAESVQIIYDPSKTSFQEILKVFFTVHDPTTLNRQGADIGTQYRSAIFYHNNSQKNIAQQIITDLNKGKVYSSPIVTEVVKYSKFYKAENYHQDYYNQNKEEPYCKMVIQPKIEKFEKIFKSEIKTK
jgi:peptide methionine sulfoxide reductase msrA/msrB